MLIRMCFLLTLILISQQHLKLRENHDYWFNKFNPYQTNDDRKWNYCDYKCLQLQNLVSNKDFVIVMFTAFLHDKFSACYVKIGSTYILWNSVIKNDMFERLCGKDQKDWLKTGEFEVSGVYGEGIGTQITDQLLKIMY